MKNFDIFRDIAERTGGDIYIGVVGPVRTGKSTLIRRFVELAVLPHIPDPNDRERTKDALPQAGGGKTIMTVEPKFIPDEGVPITLKENINLRVRMVDCTGYRVEGALGATEDEGPRMVRTPWFENEIPFEEAAEFGTRKVVSEHSTLGLVVTTDGSIIEIPRENYIPAEERVVAELKALAKPFVIVLNSLDPFGKTCTDLVAEMERKYDVAVVPLDVANLSLDDIYVLMEQVLYEFPIKEVNINLPRWVDELDTRHWLRAQFEAAARESVSGIKRLRDVDKAIEKMRTYEPVHDVQIKSMDMGTGVTVIDLIEKEDLFYRVLQEISGYSLSDKRDVVRMMKEMAPAKREYDRLADALKDVREVGYGLVPPAVEEMVFEEPELIRHGNRFGVRLKASAPSLHLIRADVIAEVSPLIGAERQSEELVKYLMEKFEEDPKKIWNYDIFGKSMSDLAKESIRNKLFKMPNNVQKKLQETLSRIINEGSGGLICIII